MIIEDKGTVAKKVPAWLPKASAGGKVGGSGDGDVSFAPRLKRAAGRGRGGRGVETGKTTPPLLQEEPRKFLYHGGRPAWMQAQEATRPTGSWMDYGGTGSFVGAGGLAVRGQEDSTSAITLDEANAGKTGGAIWLNSETAPTYSWWRGGQNNSGGGGGGGGGGYGGFRGRKWFDYNRPNYVYDEKTNTWIPRMNLYTWNVR